MLFRSIEMLLSREGQVYFLEMNTRLQVEHPVTELITGVDLVRAQLEVAATGQLAWEQHGLPRHGHAIEVRVYAEDAARGFLPQAGTALRVHWPSGPFVRVDHGLDPGDTVNVHYDPMLAKVIAHGPTREVAIERLLGALDDTHVHGVVTNLPFLRALLRSPEVRKGTYDTEWIEREFLAGFSALMQALGDRALRQLTCQQHMICSAASPPTPRRRQRARVACARNARAPLPRSRA